MNEEKLFTLASGLDYPRTPDIAGRVTARLHTPARSRFFSRTLAWSLTILLVLFASLMLIPSVRAAVIEFIRIGVVRIFPRSPVPTVAPGSTATPGTSTLGTATPGSDLPSLEDFLEKFAGETTLSTAQKLTPYQILLPTYPSDLGAPDYVYVQDAEGAMTILIWVDPLEPDRVILSLHFIPSSSWAINKFGPLVLRETQVDGQKAIWAEGPYPLILQNGNIEVTRLVNGRVLIWSKGDITYRLETDQSLEEAIKIAESLASIQ